MESLIAVVGIAFMTVIGLMILYAFLKSFLYVGRPNEVLLFSGQDKKLADGSTVGYRYIIGGRTIRIPVLEEVQTMDLRLIPVNIQIEGAYSKGGIPLNVHAIANVKISSDPNKLHNAIERFLGRGRNEIMRVAKETLEGNVRGVLATLTPEEVNENRLRFVEELQHDAEPDLEKLGLHLDTLKIQSVTDDRDYLESIGRKRIAEIIKQAEVAESNAMKSAEEVESKEQGNSEVARRDAQTEIQKGQNELRRMLAELESAAKSEEEKAQGMALAARAEAEQELQRVRTDLEALRLQADVVIPAEAQKVARELIAAGEAAEIAERGRAMAEVLRMMTEIWRDAGDAALDVFILQRMDHIMKEVSAAARRVSVKEVALIDSGDGRALPNYVSSFPNIVTNIFANLRDTVGLDVGGALVGKGSAGGPGSASATISPRAAQPAFEPGAAPARSLPAEDASVRSAQTLQTASLGSGAAEESGAPRSSTFATLQRRMAQQRQQSNPDGSDET